MTGFERRIADLLEKVRRRAEAEGLQWRKADRDVYAFRAGAYVVTFARDRDPLIAIYDEHGEELEAIDRVDLDDRMSAAGVPLADVKARIWRLGRRGAGVSAPALDRVLFWLEGDEAPFIAPAAAGEAAEAAPAMSEPFPVPAPASAPASASAQIPPLAQAAAPAFHAPHPHAELAPQAPRAADPAQQDGAPSLNGAVRPPWTQ